MTRISRTENSTNLSELQGGSGAYFHVLMPLLSLYAHSPLLMLASAFPGDFGVVEFTSRLFVGSR